jgi:nucleotide-binding universal stress UspA family protein
MFRKILVPLDGSPRSEAVIGLAADLVDAGGEVTLLIIHRPPKPTRRPRKGLRRPVPLVGAVGAPPLGVLPAAPAEYAETKDQAVEREEHEVQEYLDDIARRISPAGRRVKSAVRLGSPVREITALAKRGKFDLILMATHGRSGLQRTLHGSVTAAVIRSGAAPVLVVRPQAAAKRRSGPRRLGRARRK